MKGCPGQPARLHDRIIKAEKKNPCKADETRVLRQNTHTHNTSLKTWKDESILDLGVGGGSLEEKSNRIGSFAVIPKHTTKIIFCNFCTIILLTLFITINHQINLSYLKICIYREEYSTLAKAWMGGENSLKLLNGVSDWIWQEI